jgi:hypothetical protein
MQKYCAYEYGFYIIKSIGRIKNKESVLYKLFL